MNQQMQQGKSEQPGPSATPKKPIGASLRRQTADREGIQDHLDPRTSRNESGSRSKGKQVDREFSLDASAIEFLIQCR
jgi:hypothetical protein